MKGLLITISSFGRESHQFAAGKPIELIDGEQLNIYLRQYGLLSAVSPANATARASDLTQAAPPISPDGKYYWDGVAWQLLPP
jgi:Restriction endonuclease